MEHVSKQRLSHRHSGTASGENGSYQNFFGNACKCFLITLLTGVVFSDGASLAAYFYTDPDALVLPAGLAASAVTALIGGVVSARIHKHSALFGGMVNGLAVSALMILLSLFFRKEASGYRPWVTALLHAGFLGLSAVGAVLGTHRAPKKKKKKRA